MNFGNSGLGFVASENANNEVTITAKSVQTRLLLGGEIPGDVEPVWIARCEENSTGAISFREFATTGKRSGAHGLWRKCVTEPWAADSRRRRLVTFEQERRYFD